MHTKYSTMLEQVGPIHRPPLHLPSALMPQPSLKTSLALTDVRQKGLEGKTATRRQKKVSSVIVLTPIGLVSATSVELHRK